MDHKLMSEMLGQLWTWKRKKKTTAKGTPVYQTLGLHDGFHNNFYSATIAHLIANITKGTSPNSNHHQPAHNASSVDH